METVRLKRTSRINAGHLWVFSNELSTSPKRFEPGSLVELQDRNGVFLGIGYINPQSLIAVRVLTFSKQAVDEDFFRRRIHDAIAYRERFISGRNACRIIFSEGDFLPGLIVDRYGDCLVVQFLTLGIEKQADCIISILDELLSPSSIIMRNDSPSRLLEGLYQEKKVIKGSLDMLPVIKEDGLMFEIDPLSGQKTGFFLDQIENRIAFSRLTGKGSGLDLFCYSGAWSLHLAKNGATVTGIDDSHNAINQAQKNAGLNALSQACEFKKADVFEYVKQDSASGKQYDFVVLDPPAFVKSRTKVNEAVKAYREINANAMRLIRKGGLLATSSCSYHIDRETFIGIIRSAARDAGRIARLIELRSQAKDHPVLLSMPETEYLKCAFLEVR